MIEPLPMRRLPRPAWRRLLAFTCLALLAGPAGASFAQSATAPAPQVQLVAVQMTLDLEDYWSREAFEAKIRERMDAVAAATDPTLPTLVVFPEDVGLMLVVQGMEERLEGIASIEEVIGTAVRTHMFPLLWTRLVRWQSWVPALFLNKNRLIAETYFGTFSAVARDYGVYHVVNSGATTWYRFAETLFRTAGIPIALEPITTAQYGLPAPRPSYSVLDTAKYHALPGHAAMPDWQQALADYLSARS